jgi:leucyl-tRNA synthetase
MPIQASANRLKAEITSGKTRSVQPAAAPVEEAPKVEEKKEEPKKEEAAVPKGGKKGKDAKKAAKAPAVKRVPPTQYEILLQVGIPEDEIPKFQSAEHWLRFFPPKGKEDL